jgi:hypothetical protein
MSTAVMAGERENKMKEGDMMLETYIGRKKRTWWWRARGILMQELCRLYRPERERFIEDWHNAWLDVGPFKSRHAAERNLRKFEQAYLDFAEEKFPGLTIKNAPDARTLN